MNMRYVALIMDIEEAAVYGFQEAVFPFPAHVYASMATLSFIVYVIHDGFSLGKGYSSYSLFVLIDDRARRSRVVKVFLVPPGIRHLLADC